MPGTDRERRRATFDQAAELYDRARPGYPAELFDDLARLAGVGAGCRVLEVGPGTGQATVPLAERGCRIVAVELGEDLAAVARRRLARFPAVQVVTAAFEDWPPPAEPFDLVLAATVFHWIDPAVRVTKAADALRPGGALATIATHHVAGVTWRSSTTPRPATSAGTPTPRPAARGCRPPPRFPPPARSSTARAASAPRSSAATSGSGRTPPPATASCCSPTPATARSSPPPRPACSTASPA